MANKSNQHYVPQFYFRFFSKDGKRISVLNRKSGKLIEFAPIKGQASKSYFYGEGDVEQTLSEIEGHFCLALRDLKNRGSFEGYDRGNHLLLLQNLMLQRSRTMSARRNREEFNNLITKLQLEVGINNDDSLGEEEKEELRQALEFVEASPQAHQGLEMATAIETAVHLGDLQPYMLINKTNRPFVFGDAPVIFTNPYQRKITHHGVLGAKTPGLLVYYPLTSESAVLLVDTSVYKVKKRKGSIVRVSSHRDIVSLNKLQIHNATNAVYFSEFKYSSYVEELWRQESKKLTDHRGMVVEASGVREDGEPMGDILHTFESQLPLIPRLSILQYIEASEDADELSRDTEYA